MPKGAKGMMYMRTPHQKLMANARQHTVKKKGKVK